MNKRQLPQVQQDHNLPYFPCYIADWLIDTQDLTDEQDGSYFRLVRYQWRKGSIPDDIKIMRKISDSIDDTWPVICRYFTKNGDGNWFNSRTEKERNKIIARINAGSIGGSKTPSKVPSKVPSKSTSKTDIPQTSDLIPHNTEPELKKSEKQKRFAPPLLVDVQKRMSDPNIKNHLSQSMAGVEAEKFINFYNSNGWKVGKNKMVSWQSAVSNWLLRLDPVNKKSGLAVYKNEGEDQYKDY
jgi:uncharacterized protein YdaU (DUF1376 family)